MTRWKELQHLPVQEQRKLQDELLRRHVREYLYPFSLDYTVEGGKLKNSLSGALGDVLVLTWSVTASRRPACGTPSSSTL